MPVTILHFFRYAFRALFVALIFFGITLFSPSAYADPHAVFYTDRAQEQLFYNTLAALNQADFVEPSSNNQYSRATLLARRASAVARTSPQPGDRPFSPEQNPINTSTRTDLPAILTRGITLEGNDLWTAYLVNQFALETATRRNTSELARVYCQGGLGRVGCDTNLGSTESQQQSEAFANIPVDRQTEVAFGRDSILQSGTSDDEDIRQSIENEPKTANNKYLYSPRYYSPEIAALRQNIGSNEGALAILTGLTTGISGLSGNAISTDAFADVTFEEGEAKLPEDYKLDEYLYKLSQANSLPIGLRTIASGGEAKARLSQYYEENPTAIADSTLVTGKDGSIVKEIQVPASAKIALQNSGAGLAVQVAQNQHFANSTELATPGGKARVVPIANIPKVKGISTTEPSPTPEGQVAGLATDLYDLYTRYYENPPPTTNSPADNLINPNKESGVYDLLRAFTNDTYLKGSTDPAESLCGFCIQIDGILQQAKDTFDNIFCALFPTTEYCRARLNEDLP